MTDSFEVTSDSQNVSRVDSKELVLGARRDYLAVCIPPTRRFVTLMLILFSTVSLVAALANAQESPASVRSSAGTAGGWWSAEKRDSAAAPRLQISMAELARFDASDALRTPLAEPHNYRAAEPTRSVLDSTANLGLGVEAGIVTTSRLADPNALTPISFLSLMATDYAAWESNLSDTRSPVDVNRLSVYPVVQIDYANWHLPVALYIAPLRGSNAW
jgi:hypothetical protein